MVPSRGEPVIGNGTAGTKLSVSVGVLQILIQDAIAGTIP